ncbi:MAG: nucleosidase [Pseudomonadota bacterium]
MAKPLLVFAMKEESQEVFDDYPLLHTGIGKVNAAYHLTRYLADNPAPSLVVNMGTCGSRTHKGGTIVNCTSFIQRDMDVTVLGFEKYQTPFSDIPITIAYGEKAPFPEGVCGTGDNFDGSDAAAAFDVVDMEGYVIADICRRENVPFLCLKYVSDGADDNANEDWNAALHHAAEELRKALKMAGH